MSPPRATDPRPGTLTFVIGATPSGVGGLEILVKEICLQLNANGWDVALAWEGEVAPVVRDYFSGASVAFHVLPRQGGMRLGHIGACGKLLRATSPAIFVYAFNGILRLFPWVARLHGVDRVIYYDHSSKPVGFVPRRMPLWKRVMGRILTYPVEKVTAVAGYTGRCLAVAGWCRASKIVTTYNGVQTSLSANPEAAAAFRTRFGIPLDRKVLLQVSWLVPVKGIDVLLQAAALVLSQRGDVHFAIVGEGSHRSAYESLASELGIREHVTFTGSISNPTETGVFDAADICCQLSQWEEALGLVILEAMAAGRPMVASRVGGIPEIVVEGATGFLVERQDHQEAARRMLQLLDDDSLRARMGQAARERARENFDLQKNVARLLDAWGA